jgi:putative SOS response-associated peptidase YedK
MCGRYLVVTEDEILEYREIINEVNERYKDTPTLEAMATGEVFPTNVAPVLVAEKDKPHPMLMKWGFPKWQGSGVIINARSETALDKKMFRQPLMKRRCVIPSAGFFEWRQEQGKKVKYLFRTPETKMLYMAGFADSFGSTDSYVIITTQANEWMAPYHDRMPLILTPDNMGKWLYDLPFSLDYMHAPCTAELQATAV